MHKQIITPILDHRIRIRSVGKALLTIPTWIFLLILTTGTINISSPLIMLVIAVILILLWPGILVLLILRHSRPSWIENCALAFGLSMGVSTVPAIILLWNRGNIFQFVSILLLITLVMSLLALYSQLTNSNSVNYLEGDRGLRRLSTRRSIFHLGFLLTTIFILTYVFSWIDPVHPGGDRLTYTAFLRHFLDADQFFDSGFIVSDQISRITARQQTQTWLIVLAAIIRIADVGMLDTYAYSLPPLLGILSILIFFTFARFLFQDERTATVAVIIQGLYLLSDVNEPEGLGFGFFLRIIEDKYFVLFLMLPLALWVSLEYYSNARNRDGTAFTILTLILIGLVPLHPMSFVQFGISFGLFFFLSFLLGDRRRKFWKAAPIFATLFLLALIPLWQRQSSVTAVSFSINEGLDALRSRRLLVLSDQPNLFIASPSLLSHPLMLASIITVLFLARRVRSDIPAQFLVSNMVGLLFLGYTPFITPILGRFITPWMIWRVLWLLPVSLMLALGLSRLQRFLSDHFRKIRPELHGLTPIFIIIAAAVLLYPRITSSMGKLAERSARAITPEDRAVLDYLRIHGVPGSYILTPDETLSNEVPGFIGHSYSLTFRTNEAITPSASEDRARFYSSPLVTEDHLSILSRYGIDYLIIETDSQIDRQFRWLDDSFPEIYANEDHRLLVWQEARLSEPDLRIIEANTYFLSNQEAAAENTYLNILQQDPDDPLAHWGLATLYESRLEVEKAIEQYELAAKQMAEEASIQLRLAELIHLSHGGELESQAEEVLYHYRSALQLAPHSHENLMRVLESVSQLPDLYRSIPGWDSLTATLLDSFEQHAGENPYNLSRQIELAQAYVKLGLNSEAKDRYLVLIQRFPDTPNPYIQLATLLADQGESKEAIEIFYRALEISPNPSVIYIRLSQLYSELGDLGAARENAEKALIEAADMDQRAQAFARLGDVFLDQGDLNLSATYFHKAIGADPSKASFYVRFGDLLQQMGDLEQAIHHYRQAAALPPDQAWHHFKLGSALLDHGQVEAGIQELERALAIKPDATYFRLVGSKFMEHGYPDTALSHLEQASRLDPDDPLAKISLASIYRKNGDLDSALAFVRPLVADGDDNITRQARFELAQIYQSQQQPALALEQYLALIELDPTSPGYHESAGNLYMHLGDLESAIHHYRMAVYLPPDWPSKYVALAEALLAQGQTDEGIHQLRQALELNPDANTLAKVRNLIQMYLPPKQSLDLLRELAQQNQEHGLINLTLAQLEKDLGLLEAARSSARHALTRLADPTERALAYHELGQIYRSLGQPEEAEEMFSQAIDLEPDRGAFHLEIADLYQSQGNLTAALEHYRQAVQILPDQAWNRVLLGSALFEAGLTQEGIRELEQAILLRPEAAIHNEVGRLISTYLSTEEAISYFTEAARVDPENGSAHLNLARIYRQQEDYDLALASALQASRHAGSIEESARVHEELGQIYQAQGNYQKALQEFIEAIRAQPAVSRFYVQAGDMHLKLGHLDQALESYEKGVDLPPDWAWKHYKYGAALLESGFREEGLAELNIAIELSAQGDQIPQLVENLYQQYHIP